MFTAAKRFDCAALRVGKSTGHFHSLGKIIDRLSVNRNGALVLVRRSAHGFEPPGHRRTIHLDATLFLLSGGLARYCPGARKDASQPDRRRKLFATDGLLKQRLHSLELQGRSQLVEVDRSESPERSRFPRDPGTNKDFRTATAQAGKGQAAG